MAGIRSNGQVQLSWTAPVSNGGLSVTDYEILEEDREQLVYLAVATDDGMSRLVGDQLTPKGAENAAEGWTREFGL